MPQIKDFTLSKIIELAQEKVDIHNYLPDYEDDPTPTEYGFAIWVLTECDIYIVNTLLEEDFGKFIDEKMSEREKHVVMKRNFKVDIMPEFVKMFASSKLASSKYSS